MSYGQKKKWPTINMQNSVVSNMTDIGLMDCNTDYGNMLVYNSA